MTDDPRHEELSVFMDGELSREQARFLLRRLDRDTAALRRWDSYHLAQACLRRTLPALAGAGFADAVAARIRAQALPAAGGPRWLRWSTRFAGAAAVVAAALLLVPQQQNLDGLMPEDATASVPAPAWLNAPTDARAFESQTAGYRIVAGRDSLSMIDPLARLDASSWPHDEGVMPYLLSAHANPQVRAVDAADR